MTRRRWSWLTVVALLLTSIACAPPPRGALYAKWIAAPTPTSTAPSGASLAQYYTLGAFRVADQLASASNALDDGLIDRQQGLISADYLTLVAKRSTTAVQSALAEADQLSPPAEIRSQADTFYSAAVALAVAVSDTQQALAAPNNTNTPTLLTATQHRRTAAQTLETVMSALETASWNRPVGKVLP
ncbi:MAG: hypothetical protein ACR2JY_11935 [Chloroflexota bacterium]